MQGDWQAHIILPSRMDGSVELDAPAAPGGGLGLVGDVLVVLDLGSVQALLKDGLGLVDLELGLEVLRVTGDAGAVGAAAGVGVVEGFVDGLLAGVAPVASAATVLLGLLGVLVGKAVLGKELGDMFLRGDGAVGKAGMVLVTKLVGASHLDGM